MFILFTYLLLDIDSCTISIPTNNTAGGVQLISSGICGKHGLCISKPGGQFACSCSVGFTGDYCHESKYTCWVNFVLLLPSVHFLKTNCFENIYQEHYQNVLSVLIWVQTICKGYQQTQL